MLQKRTIGLVTDLRVREAQDGGESRTIEGYALKFGVRSRLLCDWWQNYYEVLEPGSVTRELLDTQDIKLTMFHDRQLILGRSNKGKGTLSYKVDEVGVLFWADMPRTADGDKALELIARGDISGCSFIYHTDESEDGGAVSYEKIGGDDRDPVLLRHVYRIEGVYDFTITPDPAYEQTNVTRREVFGIELDGCGDNAEVEPRPTEPEEREADESQKADDADEDKEETAEETKEAECTAEDKEEREASEEEGEESEEAAEPEEGEEPEGGEKEEDDDAKRERRREAIALVKNRIKRKI